MTVIFLVYILYCYKNFLPVLWYDWLILCFIFIGSLFWDLCKISYGAAIAKKDFKEFDESLKSKNKNQETSFFSKIT